MKNKANRRTIADNDAAVESSCIGYARGPRPGVLLGSCKTGRGMMDRIRRLMGFMVFASWGYREV